MVGLNLKDGLSCSHQRLTRISRTILAVTFIVFLLSSASQAIAQQATHAPASSTPAAAPYTRHEKGVMIDTRVLVKGLPSPSFSELKQANFTLVGTYVDRGSGSEWKTIAAWIQRAHGAGLRTFIMIGPPQLTSLSLASQWTKKAASIGTDVVELDELVSSFHLARAQLRSIIDTGLAVNPNLQFIITEYEYGSQGLTNAFSWTSDYPTVRIANDDYWTVSYIDFEITLAQQYGKAPLTWLIFSKGSQDFDCYIHLDAWMAYCKQKNIDVLFFYVDPARTWQAQWTMVLSF